MQLRADSGSAHRSAEGKKTVEHRRRVCHDPGRVRDHAESLLHSSEQLLGFASGGLGNNLVNA